MNSNNNNGNDNERDRCGFTKQQRHQMVLEVLEELKKSNAVFHVRWQKGDLFTAEILSGTPVFWYKKWGWKRKHIEKLLFKARIEVSDIFEDSLDQVFGRKHAGPRWKEGKIVYPKEFIAKQKAKQQQQEPQGPPTYETTRQSLCSYPLVKSD